MIRKHDMEFGAQTEAGGGVRFGFWAPAAARVDLCLEQETGTMKLPMRRLEEGWLDRKSVV